MCIIEWRISAIDFLTGIFWTSIRKRCVTDSGVVQINGVNIGVVHGTSVSTLFYIHEIKIRTILVLTRLFVSARTGTICGLKIVKITQYFAGLSVNHVIRSRWFIGVLNKTNRINQSGFTIFV